jgi:hypothetical protein
MGFENATGQGASRKGFSAVGVKWRSAKLESAWRTAST